VADPRFYDRLGPLTIDEIAALSGAAISDSKHRTAEIDGLAPLDEAGPGTLAYIDSAKSSSGERRFDGVAVLARPELEQRLAELGACILLHDHPRTAFARASAGLFRCKSLVGNVRVATDASIAASAHIAPDATIGAGAELGADVEIGPGAVIGPGCRIGARTRVGARAVVQCADLGEDCNILAGAVIGESGFGVAVSGEGLVDVPHLGTVDIANAVTIGANSCVDRGLFGATRIGEGSKIDNLCHIGHNTQVGRHVAMAAYAGISGSCVIEDGVLFGGRVGLHDHVKIGKGARIGGNSAVAHNVPAGETWQGDPAQPIRQHMRQVAELRRLVKAKTKKKD
jgi:UDP-3-O-[3-hydroxymyristoyl] glucosamine N-acyltransferase